MSECEKTKKSDWLTPEIEILLFESADIVTTSASNSPYDSENDMGYWN